MMRLFFMICLFYAMALPANAAPINMIFWENQSWESNGPSTRLTIWADGRSEISETVHFAPSAVEKLNPGWQVRGRLPTLVYYETNPLPIHVAKQKFAAALAAGIRDLKTFPPGYYDGSGTMVGIEEGGKLTQTIIPMFIHPGEKDNAGSDNHKKFLAVQNIMGQFRADPFTIVLNRQDITVIAWEHRMPDRQRTEHFILKANGNYEVSVDALCVPYNELVAGWSSSGAGNKCSYSKNGVLPQAEVQKRFAAMLDAGIAKLISSPPQAVDVETVIIGLQTAQAVGKTIIISPAPQDNRADPVNFQHFLAVQDALGRIDTRIAKKDKAAP